MCDGLDQSAIKVLSKCCRGWVKVVVMMGLRFCGFWGEKCMVLFDTLVFLGWGAEGVDLGVGVGWWWVFGLGVLRGGGIGFWGGCFWGGEEGMKN